MNRLTISVFIPTYNRATYLRQSLRALEQQELSPSEFTVIVSDNASDDDTAQAVEEFPLLNVEYSRNDTNLGLIGNFNRVLELCHTQFVVLMPDDVLLAPGFLKRALACFAQNDDATMYATAAFVASPSIEDLPPHIVTPPLMTPRTMWPLDLQIYSYASWAPACAFRPPIYTGAAAFRFSFLSEVMPWSDAYVANGDRLTYFEAGRRGYVLFDPWIGAYTAYDGHNFGENIPMSTRRAEYHEVTQLIMEEARKDGIDVLQYWQDNLSKYLPSDQVEILDSAWFALPEQTFIDNFGGYAVASHVLQSKNSVTKSKLAAKDVGILGRLDRWGLPKFIVRPIRAVRRRLNQNH